VDIFLPSKAKPVQAIASNVSCVIPGGGLKGSTGREACCRVRESSLRGV
jgi:hypothetical protein